MTSVVRAIALCALGAAAAGCLGEPDCPKFTHIVAGDFGRSGDTLWWTLQVEELPAQMTFNQADVPGNFLEYRWAVDIDSDGDGAVDLRASVDHFAVLNGVPVTTVTSPDILAQTNHHLLEVTGGLGLDVASIDASLSDASTFRFQTTAAASARLATVTAREQSTWTAVYRFGAEPEDQCDEAFR
jgi:hypothetical protein